MKWTYTGRVFNYEDMAIWDMNLFTGLHRAMLPNKEWIWVVDHPAKANLLAEVIPNGEPEDLLIGTQTRPCR